MARDRKITRLSVVKSDVDVLREHYAATLKPARVDPVNGSKTITAQDLHVSIGEFDVWKGGCNSGMSVSFTEPGDLFAIYLPITGAMEFRAGGTCRVSTPGSMLVCDFAKTEQIVLHENRKHVGIGFDRKMVIRELSHHLEIPIEPDFELSAEFSIEQDNGCLLSLGKLLGNNIEADPEVAAGLGSNNLILRAMLMRLLETVPHRYSHLMDIRKSPALPRHVKIAIDFMMAHTHQAITLDDIALAAGVGARTLQHAFRQFRNTTPLNYFRQLRLEKARDHIMAMREENAALSDIAKQWGFSNVGRFASLYFQAFGETPQQTLFSRRKR